MTVRLIVQDTYFVLIYLETEKYLLLKPFCTQNESAVVHRFKLCLDFIMSKTLNIPAVPFCQ